MNEHSSEFHNDEIDVEEIMEKIRNNIRRRQAAEDPQCDPGSLVVSDSNSATSGLLNENIRRDLAYISANWDTRNNSYFISSHRPYFGKYLVKGRQLVHGEVRRYVDPMISHQTEFNASMVRILTQTTQKCTELETTFFRLNQEYDQVIKSYFETVKNEVGIKIDSRIKEYNKLDQKITEYIDKSRRETDLKIDTRIKEQQKILEGIRNEVDQVIFSTVSELKNDITSEIDKTKESQKKELDSIWENIENIASPTEQQIKDLLVQGRLKVKECVNIQVNNRVREILSQLGEDIHSQAWLAHILEERVQKGMVKKSPESGSITPSNVNYFLFEERFRGSREDIKQRQLAFLPYYEKCSRVLDIGCGRGEFLEILRDHNIGSIGVDSDQDMVAYCRSRQLEVEHTDAIAYLETLADNSLDGIFIDQVVEHLEPDYLVRLLKLCHQKMKSGYHIVVETMNPLSFVSFANFYLDLTHKRPVHPETLQYLLSASGFRECEKKFFSPVSDAGRLKKIGGTTDMNETEKVNIDVYNHNVEMLNTVLFGAQDYAVVGKK